MNAMPMQGGVMLLSPSPAKPMTMESAAEAQQGVETAVSETGQQIAQTQIATLTQVVYPLALCTLADCSPGP